MVYLAKIFGLSACPVVENVLDVVGFGGNASHCNSAASMDGSIFEITKIQGVQYYQWGKRLWCVVCLEGVVGICLGYESK